MAAYQHNGQLFPGIAGGGSRNGGSAWHVAWRHQWRGIISNG